MSALHSLQQRCYEAFVAGHTDRLIDLVAGLDPASAIAIYQNNALETFRKTLTASFPVTWKLMGNDCFRTLSRDYMRVHPSTSGNLARFGAAFPDYLDGIYGGGPFDYLSDVARLEWACEEAFLADEARPMELSHLSVIPAAELSALRLYLHPSCRLVCSAYPVLTIWQSNTEDKDEPIDIGRPEHVLVARTAGRVQLHVVTASSALFVDALLRGSDLGHACDRAAGEDRDFSPLELLLHLARLDLLVQPPALNPLTRNRI